MRQQTRITLTIAIGLMLALAGCTGTQDTFANPTEQSEHDTQVIGFDDHDITCVVYNEYGGQGNDNSIDCTHDTTPAPYNNDLAQDLTITQKTNDTTCILYNEYGGQGNDNDISCVTTPAH